MTDRTQSPASNLVEYTVSELAFALRRTVEDAYGLVRLRGEISGFKGPLIRTARNIRSSSTRSNPPASAR
jgi:hypothetical protein